MVEIVTLIISAKASYLLVTSKEILSWICRRHNNNSFLASACAAVYYYSEWLTNQSINCQLSSFQGLLTKSNGPDSCKPLL